MALIQKAFSDIITFSRSSNATRVGPTGLVEYAPHNLVLQSQTFDNAAWVFEGGTKGSNTTTAPDGTVTADQYIENTTVNALHEIYQSVSVTSGQTYTFSGYFKRNGRDLSLIAYATSPLFVLNVNLATGSVISTIGSGSYTITSVGNGWYRVSATVTATATGTGYWDARPLNGTSNTYTGDGTSGIYLWGAQLSVGPYALDYTPTTSAAVYGPRFDYDPVTLAARGLLVEEQRTNLVTYSEQFDNAAWTKSNVTLSADSSVAPDGTVTADLVKPTSTGLDRRFEKTAITITSATSYTQTVYAKASGVNFIYFADINNAYNNVWFDLSAGTVSTPIVGSATITPVGNGWYRCSQTTTSSSTSGTFFVALADSSGSRTSTASGNNGVLLWGAQLEAGSFATSYIPTVASTVTRSADVASVNTLSPWFNNAQGTWFAEMDVLSVAASTYHAAFEAFLSSDDNARMFVDIDAGTAKGYIRQNTAGSGTFMSTGVSVSANSAVKIAMAFETNNNATSAGGSAVATSTTTTPTIDTVYLGRFGSAGASLPMCGHLRRIAFYPRRLTNAELQALTA